MRSLCQAAFVLLASMATASAWATEPTTSVDNLCPSPGGQGEHCNSSADCQSHTYATLCVEHGSTSSSDRSCEIPCGAGEGVEIEQVNAACALGETCVQGKVVSQVSSGTSSGFYCQSSRFRMDLTLMDQCIQTYVAGRSPTFSNNQCSLAANLTRLLDQNDDQLFDIFDVDMCIVSFLEQPSCSLNSQSAVYEPPAGESGLLCCADDDACGAGLYCDSVDHTCQRECGIVATREASLEPLERECTRPLTACNYARGRCEAIDVTLLTCEVDSDCVSGSYCFLGRCEPSCYRSLDCPSADWMCTATNRCRPLPSPESDGSFVFDPQAYAVRFARESMALDAVKNTDSSPVVIMNLATKRQALDNPGINFGYRLEVSYGIKEDTACLGVFVDCLAEQCGNGVCNANEALTGSCAKDCTGSDILTEAGCQARQADCLIDDTEQWIRLVSPFGTISAASSATLPIALDSVVADTLSPGTYPATIIAIFDNGDKTAIPVTLQKRSPSGRYAGELSVYYQSVTAALNPLKPLSFDMNIKVQTESSLVTWQAFLEANNLAAQDGYFVNLTQGYPVVGLLEGSSALSFTKGGATARANDQVVFKGIYSPDLGMMRLIGVIDIAADFCLEKSGESCQADAPPGELHVRNLFGRDIRRQIEFVGPFEESTGKFHGMYREKISGLAPGNEFTMDGGFILTQVLADNSELAGTSAPILGVEGGVSCNGDAQCASTEKCVNNQCAKRCTEDQGSASPGTGGGAVIACGEGYACINEACVSHVSFPDDQAIELIMQTQITAACGTVTETCPDTCTAGDASCGDNAASCRASERPCAKKRFGSADEVKAYLDATQRSGASTACSVMGRRSAFPQTYNFQSHIEQALSMLDPDLEHTCIGGTKHLEPCDSDSDCNGGKCGNGYHFTGASAQQSHLNVYDFLGDFIEPCDPDDDTPAPACVQLEDSECGLAHHQYVLAKNWVQTGSSAPAAGAEDTEEGMASAGSYDLFCIDTIPTEGCAPTADADGDGSTSDLERAIFLRQEHNRFWKNITEALKFKADRAASNAFMVMYRNAVNPFETGSALAYKADNLRASVRTYDELLEYLIDTPASATWFNWPARSFKQAGNDWITIAQVLTQDRIDNLADLVDLERRVFMTTSSTDFVIGNHILQQEYLVQVYLLVLQEKWQKELFGYTGFAQQIFDSGQRILNQLNDKKNAIGITSGHVFFEDSVLKDMEPNWRNYLKRLLGESQDETDSVGLVQKSEQAIDSAVEQLQGAMADIDALEEGLFEARKAYEDELIGLCGSATMIETLDDLYLNEHYRELLEGQGDSKSLCKLAFSVMNESDWKKYLACKYRAVLDDEGDAHETFPGAASNIDEDLATVFDAKYCEDGPTPGKPCTEDGDCGTDGHCPDKTDIAKGSDGFECPITDGMAKGYQYSCRSEHWDSAGLNLSLQTGLGFDNISDSCDAIVQGADGSALMQIAESQSGTTTENGVLVQLLHIGNSVSGDTLDPLCALEESGALRTIRIDGKDRACVGGEIGALLQERADIDLKRIALLDDIATLAQDLESNLQLYANASEVHNTQIISFTVVRAVGFVLETIATFAKSVDSTTDVLIAAVGCELILGLAAGTNCVGKAVEAAGKFVTKTIKEIMGKVSSTYNLASETALDVLDMLTEKNDLLRDFTMELTSQIREADNFVGEFTFLTQDYINLTLKIIDAEHRAQLAANRYRQEVQFLTDHLVGRESGSYLRGDGYIADANKTFLEAMNIATRMTMAFAHHYNLPEDAQTTLLNQLYAGATIDDIRDYIQYVLDYETQYCGMQGLDCDYSTSSEVYRLSLRDFLYPSLRDVVDAQTGAVVTAGEQFHNLITQPPYLKRRARGAYTVDQIEVPFEVSLTARENTKNGNPAWEVNPLTCNHHLTPRNPNSPNFQTLGYEGTIALNVIGSNLGEVASGGDGSELIEYQVVRGSRDYIRSCDLESQSLDFGTLPVQVYPIQSFTVGYAPQHVEGMKDVPATYATVSLPFAACINEEQESGDIAEGNCWRSFARNRSLAAPDYKLVIPLTIDGAETANTWLTGEGLPSVDKPIIEDLVFYFRYTAQPVQEL